MENASESVLAIHVLMKKLFLAIRIVLIVLPTVQSAMKILA